MDGISRLGVQEQLYSAAQSDCRTGDTKFTQAEEQK